MEKINRMRTINQCLEYIKALDPESAITEWYLRTLCKNNMVLYYMTGKKILVNLDDLLSYFNFNSFDKEIQSCI